MAEERKLIKDLGIPALVVVVIAAAFLVGRLSAQVEYLSKGGNSKIDNPTGGGVGTAAAQETPVEGRDLSIEGLKTLAGNVGVDEEKFNKCLDDGEFADKVESDSSEGAALGVSGTPTFFINGVMVVGAQPQSEFEKIIDAELKDGSGDKVATEKTERVKVELGKGYIRGNESSKVRIVEFSDFECPFCQSAQGTVRAVLDKYGDEVSLEYRHFPLSFHPNAEPAARAAECAGVQGKFWEMHDALFEG